MLSLFKSSGLLDDQQHAVEGAVVLHADRSQAVLLRWEECERSFVISGHESVDSASGSEIPEAGFYWRGIGYLDDSWMIYGAVTIEDGLYPWARVYHLYGNCKPCSNPCHENCDGCIFADMSCKITPTGTITETNLSFRKHFGGDCVGLLFEKFVHSAEWKNFSTLLRSLQQRPKVQIVNLPVAKCRGEMQQWQIHPLKNHRGTIDQFHMIGRAIKTKVGYSQPS